MKLNRKWILIMSLVLSVALATSGTLAYLTDTDSDVNVMVLGNVKIVQNEQQRTETGLNQFVNEQTMLPAVYEGGEPQYGETKLVMGGNEYDMYTNGEGIQNVLDKIVTVSNIGSVPAYIRTIIAYEDTENVADKIHMNFSGASDVDVLDPVRTETGEKVQFEKDGAIYTVAVVTYRSELAAETTSTPSLLQIFWDKTATNEDLAKAGETYEVRVLSQAVQAGGFKDLNDDGSAADDALNEAFPGITVGATVKGWFDNAVIGSPDGDKNDTNNPPRFAITPDSVDSIDFTQAGQTFKFGAGDYGDLDIPVLGEGSVLDFGSGANVGALTLGDNAVITGEDSTIESIKVERNSTEPIELTIDDAAGLTVTGEVNVGNTNGKSILNVTDSNIKAGTIFVGGHTLNAPEAMAEFKVDNSYISCDESSLGSTIAIWGASGVDATITDSEIHTYSRGWHQSEDANDNSITFQGADHINVDIERSNMHLYGARSIINARAYGGTPTIDFKIDESLIWVVTKSNHAEETLPVWGATEITDSMLLFTKNVHQSTPAVFKSSVYGDPVIHGNYAVTTQCQWDADIVLADDQTVTFAKDANVSIYDGAGNVRFVCSDPAQVVVEDGATLTNIGVN